MQIYNSIYIHLQPYAIDYLFDYTTCQLTPASTVQPTASNPTQHAKLMELSEEMIKKQTYPQLTNTTTPTIYVVAGIMGSGKSYFINNTGMIPNAKKLMLISIDPVVVELQKKYFANNDSNNNNHWLMMINNIKDMLVGFGYDSSLAVTTHRRVFPDVASVGEQYDQKDLLLNTLMTLINNSYHKKFVQYAAYINYQIMTKCVQNNISFIHENTCRTIDRYELYDRLLKQQHNKPYQIKLYMIHTAINNIVWNVKFRATKEMRMPRSHMLMNGISQEMWYTFGQILDNSAWKFSNQLTFMKTAHIQLLDNTLNNFQLILEKNKPSKPNQIIVYNNKTYYNDHEHEYNKLISTYNVSFQGDDTNTKTNYNHHHHKTSSILIILVIIKLIIILALMLPIIRKKTFQFLQPLKSKMRNTKLFFT